MREDIVFIDEDGAKQIGKVIGFYPNTDIMISDYKLEEIVRVPRKRIEGEMPI